ncbi:hypothetical protein EKO24_002980 [Candidatus Methylobacter oryzae]|uniref:Uncharacterized protein n=1 Tax=Candidatus Methylobacter oryzae TaxID=2497749 RepID=A0ABY3CF82_9GAMM|nr:hypothetical protein EKO24_002980 [Candidatus Methylobacter oryzae]
MFRFQASSIKGGWSAPATGNASLADAGRAYLCPMGIPAYILYCSFPSSSLGMPSWKLQLPETLKATTAWMQEVE